MDSNMYLKPSNIFYTQDDITDHFGRNTPHRKKAIGETLDDLCEGRCKISDIETITVTKKNNKWYTLDNRRLWVFHHLEAADKCTQILVNVNPCPSSYDRKNSSTNGGKSVTIYKGRSPGGEWHKRLTPVTPQVQEKEVEPPESKCKDSEVKETNSSEEGKPIAYINEDDISPQVQENGVEEAESKCKDSEVKETNSSEEGKPIANINEDDISPQVQENGVEEAESKCKDSEVKETNSSEDGKPIANIDEDDISDDVRSTGTTVSQVTNIGLVVLTNTDAIATTSGGPILPNTNAAVTTSGSSILPNINDVAITSGGSILPNTDAIATTSGGSILPNTDAIATTSGGSILPNTNDVATTSGEAIDTVQSNTDNMNKTSWNLALISTDVQPTSSRISAFSDEFGEYHHLLDSESKLKSTNTQCNQTKRTKPYDREVLTQAHEEFSTIQAQSELSVLQKNHTEKN